MKEALRQRYGIDSDRPMIALAPMAGVTDLPFRTLCELMGADYSVTEMAASAPQLLQSEKNQSRLHFTETAKVKILQIIGNDPKQMAEAAVHYSELGADIIDINLGCPAKKVSRKGAGSALLSDLNLVKKILSDIVDQCPIPVTVKTRLGTDHDNYTLNQVGEIVSNLGIDLLTVHGRTRACKFNGHAKFDEIAALKRNFPQLAVIANGDIDSVDSALAVLQQTQCDGLMIGRGSVGNPWLFNEIKSQFLPDFTLSKSTKKAVILNHITQIHHFYGERKGVRFARKHIQAYLKYLNQSPLFSQLAKIETAEAQRQILLERLQDT